MSDDALVREMFDTRTGKALMLVLHMITPTGRQGIKDLCMDNSGNETLGEGYRTLLQLINLFERGLGQLHRTKE